MPLISDCICQHVGYCDGSCQHSAPPETWVECPQCSGSGVETFGIRVYEHGCGFAHDSSDERPCPTCHGTGGWIDDVEADR